MTGTEIAQLPVLWSLVEGEAAEEHHERPGLLRVSTIYAPYIDHDVFDHQMSLGPEMFIDHSFHDDAATIAYPAFADIPYETGHGAAPDPRHIRGLARDSGWYAMRHGTGELVDRRRLLARLTRGMIDGKYTITRALRVPMVIDLLQIERVVA